MKSTPDRRDCCVKKGTRPQTETTRARKRRNRTDLPAEYFVLESKQFFVFWRPTTRATVVEATPVTRVTVIFECGVRVEKTVSR